MLFVGILSFPVFASRVRKLSVDSSKMYPIFLRMGRSTVLSFDEKPQRVVVGNQNYYNIEFVKGTNHVTLQPQSTIATNLFIYGKNNVYGFILVTKGSGQYDDLVKIRWKSKIRPKRVKGKLIKLTFYKKSIIDKSITYTDLMIKAFKMIKKNNDLIIDFIVNYSGIGKADLKKLSLSLKKRKKEKLKMNTYIEKRFLTSSENGRIRIFLNNRPKRGLVIYFNYNGIKKKLYFSKKMLQ